MSRAPIMIMAGGTGGHIYPALAIAEALAARSQPVVWLGTTHGLEARVVVDAGIPIEWLSISGLRGKGVLGWLLAPFRLLWAVLQALRSLRRHSPRLVIGMGGFVSGPGGIAARLAGIPLIVHEQNAIAGMTNRWLAKFADRALQGFAGAFDTKVGAITVGNPVRDSIRRLPPPETRFAEHDGALRLLVIGGSQGARALNEMVPAALALMPAESRPLVRHQAGSATLELAQDGYSKTGVHAEVTAFVEDMAGALGWADLVICRAGALTIAELVSVGIGAVLVPFPAAVDDHQTANARTLVEAGAALIVPQPTLTAESLSAHMSELGSSREALLKRAVAARSLRRDDAVALVLNHCADVLQDDSLRMVAS